MKKHKRAKQNFVESSWSKKLGLKKKAGSVDFSRTSMSSELAVFPDPKTVKSSLEPEIGEHYIPLVTACLHWACETNIHMVGFSGLADALKNRYVKTIGEISEALERKGKGSSVSKFLLQLSHHQSG